MGSISFYANISESDAWGGKSIAGLYNVESGSVSIRTDWLEPCSCGIGSWGALQYTCKKCEKSPKNNLTIPSGDGDGMYPVFYFVNNKGETFAAITLFDYRSEIAQQIMASIAEEEIMSLDWLESVFEINYPGTKIGQLNESFGSVLFSDAHAGVDSEKPTVAVSDWVSGGMTLYGFFEDSLDNAGVKTALELGGDEETFNGGLDGSIRARAILVLSDAYSSLSEGLVDFEYDSDEWEEQIAAWSKQLVASNIAEDQSLTAIHWNAKLENNYGINASSIGADPSFYGIKEYSWYLQGAESSDEYCLQLAQEMVEESGGELAGNELMQYSYMMRGLFTKSSEYEE